MTKNLNKTLTEKDVKEDLKNSIMELFRSILSKREESFEKGIKAARKSRICIIWLLVLFTGFVIFNIFKPDFVTPLWFEVLFNTLIVIIFYRIGFSEGVMKNVLEFGDFDNQIIKMEAYERQLTRIKNKTNECK